MKIIKKDGLIELWDSNKILEAIKKASLRCEANITKEQALNVADKVKETRQHVHFYLLPFSF